MAVAGDNEKRELYLASSMSELDGQVDPGEKIKNTKSASMTPAMLNDLYLSGRITCRMDKDEELSYLLFKRFMLLFKNYRKRDRAEFTLKSEIIILLAKGVADSLRKRYAIAKKCKAAEAKMKELELQDATRNFNKNSGGIGSEARPAVVNGVIPSRHHELDITPEELKTLMDQKSTRFLLIDTRSPEDFKSSHPLHRDAICISNSFLVTRISANTLTTKLMQSGVESLELWNIRATFDLIILYDWMNSFEYRDPTLPLFVLYDVITQYDHNTKYKGQIKILQGGFRHFYRKYPTYFTNLCTNGQLDEFAKSSASGHASLSGIEYPSLGNAPPPPPPVTVKPLLQTIQKPTIRKRKRATKPTHLTTIKTESKPKPLPTAVTATSPVLELAQPKATTVPAPSIPQVHAPVPPPSSLKPAALFQNTATTKDEGSVGIARSAGVQLATESTNTTQFNSVAANFPRRYPQRTRRPAKPFRPTPTIQRRPRKRKRYVCRMVFKTKKERRNHQCKH